MPREIVINVCYGGYTMSDDFKTIYNKRREDSKLARPNDWLIETDVSRDDLGRVRRGFVRAIDRGDPRQCEVGDQ